MADPLPRQGPLTPLPLDETLRGFACAIVPPMARFILRADDAARAAAGRGLGLELPSDPCRAATRDGRSALWLGPDEWLLLAAEADGPAVAAAIADSAAGTRHALFDVGHRQIGLALSGPLAADVLAQGCPLDLDPSAFPVGMCTRTLLAKTEIVLWRRDAERFHVEVARSFARYAGELIVLAARGAAAMAAAAGSR
ncbi:MAG: sarcosine oxidase subunit gamma [Alphaproteobacteria bacterium]|nr:sarcosine oxidase subunit gamma [Alphaproteobacteria bacterium]